MNDVELPERIGTNRGIQWHSDLAAEMLRRLDIPYIAMNPGASYRGFQDSLVNYLGNRNPQMLVCLHEDHVVSIAHGYAKATGKPMACVLHSNVGLMHGLMGIFNAWCDRIPMIVIGATGPVEFEKRRPWIDWIHTCKDQGALLRNFTKWDDEPRSAQGIVQAFLRGAHLTTDAPTAPVYICLDAGLQEQVLPDAVEVPNPHKYRAALPPAANECDVVQVAERIANAKQPVFLFGRGSRESSAWDRRVKLAELTAASVLTSQRERASFPTEHGLHVGPPIDPITAEAKQALSEADVIVSFDWVDLNGLFQDTTLNAKPLSATVVHISLDLALHNGWSLDHFGLPPVDLQIKADPDTFVEQLLGVLTSSLIDRPRWDGKIRFAKQPLRYSERANEELVNSDIEMALAETRGSRQFTLAHLPLSWAGTGFHYRDPLDFLGHDGGAGLAAGPGITVGAALAMKDTGRPVISVLGDGDFLQGATALWTASHYRIPALFIVANNRSNFNDEIHQNAMASFRKRPRENNWIGQRLTDPELDLVGLAKAQGVEGEGPIKARSELLLAIQRGLAALESGNSYFIDVQVKPPVLGDAASYGRVGR
jgi:thiamine pyrophosphate-dependent acetolactate synthase large subunit-like protein